MENLEIQEKVINLGKKLISNLQQQNTEDEITIWMTNYLAEQITIAKEGSKEAKEKCFNTILQLWQRRSIFPDGTRPFEDFEPIFEALSSLSPESSLPRYFSDMENGDALKTELEAHKWVEATKGLDATTRILITFLFEQAIEKTIDANTKDWLKTISGIEDSNEYKLLTNYMNQGSSSNREQRIDNITSRIKQLQEFENLGKSVRQSLSAELELLKRETVK